MRAIIRIAEEQNFSAYVVGGFIRDVLLDIPSLDLDIVIEGSAIRMGELLSDRFGGKVTVHRRFHTAVWHIADGRKEVATNLTEDSDRRLAANGLPPFLDLITARQESYSRPGALPEVRRATIKEDLFRRDFTVNALAARLHPRYGEFLDLWGGYEDLRRKQLRTLHGHSFSDDPTRILRILRLTGRLGFQIEGKTLRQLKRSLGDLKHVSPQRIYNDLFLILQEEKRVTILREMQRLGVLENIHPNLEFEATHRRSLARMPTRVPANWGLEPIQLAELGFILWFIHMDYATANRLVAHFGMPAPIRKAILDAISLMGDQKLQNLSSSELTSRLDSLSPLSIYAFFLHSNGTPLAKRVAKYNSSLRHIQPYTDGKTLQRMGLSPGPVYSRILKRLRDAWLDGEIKSRREETKFLICLLEEYKKLGLSFK